MVVQAQTQIDLRLVNLQDIHSSFLRRLSLMFHPPESAAFGFKCPCTQQAPKGQGSMTRGGLGRLWHALLRIEAGLLAGVVDCVSELDAAYLSVYALEYNDQATAELIRDRSPVYPFEKKHLLHVAAAHGCLRAVHKLSQRNSRPHDVVDQEPLLLGGSTSTKPSRSQLMAGVRRYLYPEDVMYEAAKQGDMQVVQWLHSTTKYIPFIAVEHAARAGHLAIAQWLANLSHEGVDEKWKNQSRNASVEVIVPFHEGVGIFAWFVSNYGAPNVGFAHQLVHRSYFVFRGKQNVVVSVVDATFKNPEKLSNPVVFAAEEGNMELLQVLKNSRSQYNWPFTTKAIVQALKKGQLDAALWLMKNIDGDYTVDELVTTAIESDKVQFLKWLDSRFQLEPVLRDRVRFVLNSGSLEVVRWFFERFPSLPFSEKLFETLPCRANVAMWLHEDKGLCLNPDMRTQFVYFGDVQLLEAFLERFPVRSITRVSTFENTCRSGKTEMARYLAEQHGIWSEDAADLASRHGQLGTVKWVLSTGRPISGLQHFAAQNLAVLGAWDLLEGFFARGQVAGKLDFCLAASFKFSIRERRKADTYPDKLSGYRLKDLEWMKRFVELGLKYSPEAFDNRVWLGSWASRHAHTDILRRLIDLGYSSIVTKANLERILQKARDGTLVQVFLEHRPDLVNPQISVWAAKFKQLPLLEFLFSRVTVSDDAKLRQNVHIVITVASRYGHLAVLKWMHQRKLVSLVNPWKSATSGHVHILQWLHENKLMDTRKLRELVQECAKTEEHEVVQWFRQNETEC